MKRISIFFLLTSLFFTSCSNDDPSPDLTPDFIGTWKSEVLEDQVFRYYAIWNISKVSNNEVKIVITTKGDAKTQYYDSYEFVEIVERVKLSDARTMDLKMTQTDDGEEYSVDGTGIMTGKKITVAGKSTNKKTGEFVTINETLTKQ